MDYTNPYSKERLTGRGYFTATGATSALDIGDVQAFEIDFGIKRKEHFSARRGVLVMDRYDAYASMAKWQITVDEFASPLLPLVWNGTVNANYSQTLAAAATFNWTMAAALKGQVLDIGKFGLFSASLTTPGSKVEGYTADYVIDRGAGKLYIPLSTTIPNGAAVVTYSAPALTYDSIAALNILNRPGTFQLHAEDDSGSGVGAAVDAVPPSRSVYDFPCILSVDKQGAFKPDDYRDVTLIITLTGTMTVKRLQ